MKLTAYLLALVVLGLDQLSKYWVINSLRLEDLISKPILPFFSLTWVENRGVSMGLLTASSDTARWALVAMTAVIALFVAFWIQKEKQKPEILALGLVLGGAIGNIIDRIRFGYVVDFVHLHAGDKSFYVFNIADAAITIGAGILLIRAVFGGSDSQSESKA